MRALNAICRSSFATSIGLVAGSSGGRTFFDTGLGFGLIGVVAGSFGGSPLPDTVFSLSTATGTAVDFGIEGMARCGGIFGNAGCDRSLGICITRLRGFVR